LVVDIAHSCDLATSPLSSSSSIRKDRSHRTVQVVAGIVVVDLSRPSEQSQIATTRRLAFVAVTILRFFALFLLFGSTITFSLTVKYHYSTTNTKITMKFSSAALAGALCLASSASAFV